MYCQGTKAVYQPGDSSKEKTAIVNGIDDLKQGDNHMLFIIDWDGKYTPFNPVQGDIKIVDKKSIVNKVNRLFQDGIAEDGFISSIQSESEMFRLIFIELGLRCPVSSEYLAEVVSVNG
jgi:hypothetical protein